MERRQVEYFLAVAENGSFSAASLALDVAQPSLSQAIATLETDLGSPLFHRLPRGVRLTAAGEAFLGPARQLQRDLQSARDAVVRVRDIAGGVLDLACPPTLGSEPLAALVGAMRQRYPDLAVNVIAPSGGLTANRLVESGAAEVALSVPGDPVGELASAAYSTQQICALLPPGSERPGPLPIAELLEMGLVVTPRGGTVRAMLEDLLGESRVTESVVVETDFEEAMAALVHAGAGVCLVPAPLSADAERLGLVSVMTDPPLERQVVVTHRRATLSPAAQTFVDLMEVSPA